MQQQQQQQILTKNNNRNIFINNNKNPTISTTNTSSVALSGLYQIDDNNMRLFFNDDLNFPFVIDYNNNNNNINNINNISKHRRNSVSPNNRHKSSNSLERKAYNNEKYNQINALVNNKGSYDQQQQQQQQMLKHNNINSSPYFYKDGSFLPPSPSATNKKSKIPPKNNNKEDVLVTGNFISGKQYYQHISKNPNIFELLNNNENVEETQELAYRFNALNIPSNESQQIPIRHQQQQQQQQNHLNTVYAQQFDDENINTQINDFQNSSNISNATSTSTTHTSHTNKATKHLSKLLKHLKKKLKSSSKVEKFTPIDTTTNVNMQFNNYEQQNTSINNNNNNLTSNDLSTIPGSSSNNYKQKLDNSLPIQPSNVENSKKQNRDIITKLYKAYNRKFDKNNQNSKSILKSNNSNSNGKINKIPSTLVTEIFAVSLDNNSTNNQSLNEQINDNEDNEMFRKRTKTYRSESNLAVIEAQNEAHKFDSEMTFLLKTTKEKFGNDLQISNKTIENNNYLNTKLKELKTRMKSSDNLTENMNNKFKVNDLLLNTIPQQNKLNENAQSFIKFQKLANSNTNIINNVTSISIENDLNALYKQQIPKPPIYLQKFYNNEDNSLNNDNKINENNNNNNNMNQQIQLLQQQQQQQVDEMLIDPTANLIRSKSFNNNLSLTPSSKKRVSFHEQVIKTDVESGNSTLVPILYTNKEKQYPIQPTKQQQQQQQRQQIINDNELNLNSNFKLNHRTPADTLSRAYFDIPNHSLNVYNNTNMNTIDPHYFIPNPEIIYPPPTITDSNRKYEIININKNFIDLNHNNDHNINNNSNNNNNHNNNNLFSNLNNYENKNIDKSIEQRL